ncbi:TonB-dependent receptor [uncultured Paludibaculum sp.]|uniref:TonB-dependent receptor n=1 Tax=uncultured Paludibaculum sp. TaxID=1765020 RepID=UPI002AAC49DD|nr:TonB-dependent receptor [uncultured Paludibaculum sp.]
MKNSSRFMLALMVLAMLVGWSMPAWAQSLYGSVVGQVEDPSGSAIIQATATLTNKGTGQVYEAKADEGGRFLIANVLPGDYDLKVTANGFRTQNRTDIRVSAAAVTRADVRMEVGAVSEQITVEASATALQTDKADTHTELNAKQVSNLPLPGFRNYQSLINLVPGATPASFQNSITDSPGRSLATNINGTNKNNNVTRIDGAASVNLWLPHHAGYVMPAEMVDTVNVTTAAGDSDQGMAGGAAVTVLTKSGTNQIHGSLFEYHDNQNLKAFNYFTKATATSSASAAALKKPLRIYNNYGGTIGGPIKKNKLFYFYSFDGTRQRDGNQGTYSVPTAAMRAGDFSAINTTIYDPLTGSPDGTGRTAFAGNKIPTSRMSPAAQKIQGYYPLPNTNLTGYQANYFASAVPAFNRDYNDIKINYNMSDKQQIFGHYGIMKALVVGKNLFGDGVGPAPGADPGTGDTKVQNMSLGTNRVITSNLLFDGVIGYQRQDQTVQGVDFGKDFSTTLGIPGIGGPDPRQQGFPNISINGYDGFGVPGWMPLTRVEENYTLSANVTWTKGKHNFRFGFNGVNYRMTHWQPELGAGPRGSFDFTGGPTSIAGGSTNNFNGYSSFLLGQSNSVQKSFQYITMTPREFQFSWYAQDRWQISRKLTMTLGLRYELYPLMTRATGKGIERLDPETNLVYLGGRGNNPTGVGVTVSHKLISPTMGIAYRLDDKTVIRTGYGINFDPLPFSRPLRGFYPLTINIASTASGSEVAGSLEQGIPATPLPDLSSGVLTLPKNADMRSPYLGQIHRGYTQSWNFTIERKLPQDILTTVAYVGTSSVHLLADRNINSGVPGPSAGAASRQPYYDKFGRNLATNMWDGYLSSNYHSLQTSVRKSLSKGLMLQGAYTWSKAINMTDEDGWASVGWNWGPAFRRNRAAAGYDRTHVLQMGWVYELPMGKGKQFVTSGVGAMILGGWSVNGVMSNYTGTPFTVSGSGGALNAAGNTATADQVGPANRIGAIGAGSTYYNTSAFANVTTASTGGVYRFGTAGRNILRNPGVWNTDLMINRTFQITERISTAFRAEFYNLPNTSHFGGVSSGDVTNGNFMRILSSSGERQVRFGLRLGF